MYESIKNYSEVSKNPFNLVRTLIYKRKFWLNNPTYFDPSGIWVYCGSQGSGKTLSAVQTLKKMALLYPKAKIVSNMPIFCLPDRDIIPFSDYSQLEMSNGIEGVIFFLDELHVLWNSLESKDIPISEMAIFCQNRKDRRVIIGTSQVYSRIAKPIREQLQYVVDCHCILGSIQYNQVLNPQNEIEKDGHIQGELVQTQIFFHSPDMYQAYETLNKISRLERKELKKDDRVSNITVHRFN